MHRTALALALIAAPVAAHAQAAPAPKAALDLVLERGKLLYAYDQAAWHASDDMLAKVPDAMNTVGGWIVDGPADRPTAVFLDRDAANPHIVYTAQFRDGKLVSSRVLGAGDDRSLSPERKAIIAARDTGIAWWNQQHPPYCSKQRPNVAVLPPLHKGDRYLVYILNPTEAERAYAFGGHIRVDVTPDGKVADARGFSKTCLTITLAPQDKPAAIQVNYVLEAIPNELHVFNALAADLPIDVTATDGSKWRVTGKAIVAVAPPDKANQPP